MKYNSVITLSIRALTWSSLLTSQALASHTPPECYQVRISPTCHHISLARHMIGCIYTVTSLTRSDQALQSYSRWLTTWQLAGLFRMILPEFVISAVRVWSWSLFLLTATIVNPSFANLLATAWPIPGPAPAIKQTPRPLVIIFTVGA